RRGVRQALPHRTLANRAPAALTGESVIESPDERSKPATTESAQPSSTAWITSTVSAPLTRAATITGSPTNTGPLTPSLDLVARNFGSSALGCARAHPARPAPSRFGVLRLVWRLLDDTG